MDETNKDDSANDEHETETEDHTEDGDSNGRQPRKKLKRGRKLKVLKDNNEETPISGAAVASAGAVVSGQNSLKKKKARKTTKNVNKKTMNQSMTSDEDEECSASNCSRPPGKIYPTFRKPFQKH